MDITSYLASIANSFMQRYANLTEWTSTSQRNNSAARQNSASQLPKTETTPSKTEAAETPEKTNQAVDTYEPSKNATRVNKEKSDVKDTSEKKPAETPAEDAAETNPESPVEVKPDGTYYYNRQVKMDYRMKLQFDLGALVHTATEISEGDQDQASVQQFTAAGFGLSADFALKGQEIIETNMPDENQTDDQKHLVQKNAGRARRLGMFNYQSREMALQSFYREAANVRKSLDVKVQDGQRRAVNRIALRYHLDNHFNMSLGDKFNIQTKDMAEQSPEALAKYFDTTGELASKGSSDLLETFFNATEDYLNNTEQSLMSSVEQYFNQAAEQLGLSSDLTDRAREQLMSSIDSFFDRALEAVSQIESQFIPTNTTQPVGEPDLAPVEPVNPAIATDRGMVAEA